jgi:hypothetical protein
MATIPRIGLAIIMAITTDIMAMDIMDTTEMIITTDHIIEREQIMVHEGHTLLPVHQEVQVIRVHVLRFLRHRVQVEWRNQVLVVQMDGPVYQAVAPAGPLNLLHAHALRLKVLAVLREVVHQQQEAHEAVPKAAERMDILRGIHHQEAVPSPDIIIADLHLLKAGLIIHSPAEVQDQAQVLRILKHIHGLPIRTGLFIQGHRTITVQGHTVRHRAQTTVGRTVRLPVQAGAAVPTTGLPARVAVRNRIVRHRAQIAAARTVRLHVRAGAAVPITDLPVRVAHVHILRLQEVVLRVVTPVHHEVAHPEVLHQEAVEADKNELKTQYKCPDHSGLLNI